MGGASVRVKLALVLSLSAAAFHSSSSSRFHLPEPSIPSPPPPPPRSSSSLLLELQHSSPPNSKASVSDLLSLLATNEQSSSLNPNTAAELRSCLKFLVPFTPTPPGATALRQLGSKASRREEDELVWWPPEPVLKLARLSFDSAGDPGAIHRTLDPTVIPIPDVEGSKKNKCQLTRTPYGRRFINEEINSYLKFLFELIAARGPEIGLNVSLNRFDFFHGHVFLATESNRLGILFHAKEYPAYRKQLFPFNMGYCQRGSTVTYDDSMNLRNILWLAPLPSNSTKAWLTPGVLVVLDAHPQGIIYRDLIPEYVHYVRTLYEDDFGDVVVDVNYLNVGRGAAPDYQIFIC